LAADVVEGGVLRARRSWLIALTMGAFMLVAPRARAVDFEDVGGEPLTLDITNTSILGYHFDNRNVTTGPNALLPSQHVDDNYGDWFNQLYLRLYYWKMSLGVRLDSAVFFNTLDRQGAQDLVIAELGAPDLGLENDVSRELHARYSQLVYPAKLWIGFKHEGLDVTAGDFYQQLGRGLVFSVRKIDEAGIDTTVRGGKLEVKKAWEGFRIGASAFGGQLNPIRIDYPTGRILHGAGSPMFFAFPTVDDFLYYRAVSPTSFELSRDRARPSYLEDNVAGANLTLGPREVQFEVNGAILLRQSNSEEQKRCLEGVPTGDPRAAEDAVDLCNSQFVAFNEQDETRSHDQIRNFSGAVRVPPIEEVVDGYVELAGQQQTAGRVLTVDPGVERQVDVWGYAVYANVNVRASILSFTLQGKHYRNFFPLAANIDLTSPGFGAPEYNIVNYSEPPTTESIYTEPIGAPDVCNTGGRARVDAKISDKLNIYGWGGHYVSFTEIDPNLEAENPADPQSSRTCTPSGQNSSGVSRTEARRTNTSDLASGAEIDLGDQGTHYWGWVGARFTDRAVATELVGVGAESAVFYREGYVRYDFNQHLAGDFSLSAIGYHRRRYEPIQLSEAWWEGENLLALNWNPHLAFIFGYEYQTRPGLPDHYFNGAIQYRSQDDESWYGQLFDTVRVFAGQRRSALRCVGGVCRVYPAFEGARLELVSRF
jgi:hypothetical protein